MNRTRSTTTGAISTSNVRTYKTRSTCSAGFSGGSSETTLSGSNKVKTITDVTTPGFYGLLRCGKFLPLNPLDIITTTRTQVPGNGTVYANFSGGCWKSQFTGPKWLEAVWGVALPPDDEDLVDALVTEAVAEAKAATWDSLTFVGEFDQTVDLFLLQLERLHAFERWLIRKVKRRARNNRRIRSKRDLLVLFSNMWLEYAFGWQPLIRDLNDGLKALHRVGNRELFEGASSNTVDLGDSDVTTTTNSFSSVVVSCTLAGSRKYRAHAYAQPTSDRAHFGVDPLVSGWELARWSFVIDYFVNVGSWLQAWSPFSGAQLLGAMASVRDSYVLEQHVDISYFNTQTGEFSGVSTKIEVDRYTRYPASPGSLPSWNPRLTPKRIVNLVALVISGKRRTMKRLYE